MKMLSFYHHYFLMTCLFLIEIMFIPDFKLLKICVVLKLQSLYKFLFIVRKIDSEYIDPESSCSFYSN